MEAPHHKYCKCPDCELFAQMQAHFGTNEPEPNTRAGEALKPCPWCSGKGFAQSPSLGHSSWRVICDDCCAEGPTVPSYNVDDPEAFCIIAWNNRIGNVAMSTWDHYAEEHVDTRPLPQPSELVDDDARLILRLAGVRNKLTPGAIERADLDGMAFTIGESQDRIAEMSAQLTKLQADGDKLAGALERSRQGWSNVLELGLLPVQHQSTALGLHEAATQALTEWKDRA